MGSGTKSGKPTIEGSQSFAELIEAARRKGIEIREANKYDKTVKLEKGDLEKTKNIVAGATDLLKEFPELKETLQYISPANLRMGGQWLGKGFEYDVRYTKGYSENSYFYMLGAHETAHGLSGVLNKRFGISGDDIVKQAIQNLKSQDKALTSGRLRLGVSKYATKDLGETFADAIAKHMGSKKDYASEDALSAEIWRLTKAKFA